MKEVAKELINEEKITKQKFREKANKILQNEKILIKKMKE